MMTAQSLPNLWSAVADASAADDSPPVWKIKGRNPEEALRNGTPVRGILAHWRSRHPAEREALADWLATATRQPASHVQLSLAEEALRQGQSPRAVARRFGIAHPADRQRLQQLLSQILTHGDLHAPFATRQAANKAVRHSLTARLAAVRFDIVNQQDLAMLRATEERTKHTPTPRVAPQVLRAAKTRLIDKSTRFFSQALDYQHADRLQAAGRHPYDAPDDAAARPPTPPLSFAQALGRVHSEAFQEVVAHHQITDFRDLADLRQFDADVLRHSGWRISPWRAIQRWKLNSER